jgi:hypothetical protein
MKNPRPGAGVEQLDRFSCRSDAAFATPQYPVRREAPILVGGPGTEHH